LAYFGDNLSLMAYFTPYVTVAAAMLIPWRAARTVMLGVSTIGIGIAFYEAELLAGVLSATGLIVGFSIGQGLRNAAMERQLQEAEERTAVLAVAAERERIGRDLHDILGHSLTTIAIKADLASRLAERDIDAARSEIDDVAAVARQALADVRATASGMREVRLAAEIASARSVLGAAAIRAETPSALPVLDDETSELMGYVVREAVTNVLRHSGASRCRIVVDEDSVEISDDGAGFPAGTLRSGLRGLDDRLREAGWRLTITSDDGVTVRAEKGRDVS
ncbi:MAG: sensor histidine kinase, partial [Propionibacterium sp.]|nr:sensor histidine kinase [Propionibacterium sp.]